MAKHTTKQNNPLDSLDILNNPERRIRLPEVKLMTGYRSTAAIYSKVSDGSFPAPYKMGGRAVAWRLGDVLDFLNSCSKTTEVA